MTVHYHPALEEDLKAIRAYYEDRSPGLGYVFIGVPDSIGLLIKRVTTLRWPTNTTPVNLRLSSATGGIHCLKLAVIVRHASFGPSPNAHRTEVGSTSCAVRVVSPARIFWF